MGDFLQAIIEFFTDLFAALAEFLGNNSSFGDIMSGLGSLEGVLPEETPDAKAVVLNILI